MQLVQKDLQHLSSFRRGDLLSISQAKNYFDNLSQNPHVFMQRMLRILQTGIVPKDEVNLIIFMLKGLLENKTEWVNKQQLAQYLNFLIAKYYSLKNDGMLQLILALMIRVSQQYTIFKIQEMIQQYFLNPNIQIIKLMTQILNCQQIGISKIIPFEQAKTFKQFPVNSPQLQKYYSIFLLKLSEHSLIQRLTLKQCLSLITIQPTKAIMFIKTYYIPTTLPINLLQTLQYLSTNIYKQLITNSQQIILSLNSLVKQIFEKLVQYFKLPSFSYENNMISSMNFFITQYFYYLVSVFNMYRKRVQIKQIQDDVEFIKNIFFVLQYCIFQQQCFNVIVEPIIKQLKNFVFSKPIITKDKQAQFIIISSFIDNIKDLMSKNDYQSIIQQIKQNRKNKEISFGFISFIFRLVVKKHSNNKIQEYCKQICENINSISNASLISTHIIIRIFFVYSSLQNSESLLNLITIIDSKQDEQKYSLISLLSSLFQSEQMTQDIYNLIIEWTTDFNNNSTFLKMINLDLLTIAVKKYDLGLIDLGALWMHIQSFSLQNVHMDVFCKLLTQILKTHNQKQYDLQGLPEYCQNLFIITCKHYDVYQLAMEIVNVPTRSFKLLQRFRNMLAENVDNNNQKLLDIIELLIIMYPVTSNQLREIILSKLDGKAYFRFYWRFRPQYPPKPLTFQIDDVITLKWVILSQIVRFQKTHVQNTSKQDINLLIHSFGKISIQNSNKQKLIDLIHKLEGLEDNTKHWIGEWRTNTVKKTIMRDFNNQSKSKILERYRVAMKQNNDC